MVFNLVNFKGFRVGYILIENMKRFKELIRLKDKHHIDIVLFIINNDTSSDWKVLLGVEYEKIGFDIMKPTESRYNRLLFKCRLAGEIKYH